MHLAAVQLPKVDWKHFEPRGVEGRVSAREYEQILRRARRLPFQYYWEILDPHTLKPDEPACGDLYDDLADTWRDVKNGLLLYRAGKVAEAGALWKFNFDAHWGEHATGALRAIYCYFQKNAEPGEQ